MRNKFYLITLVLLLTSITATSQEVSLFNSDGEPVAYIDTRDEDLTIYMWEGSPVAYLTSANNGFNIYGFNGKHLGWFDEGLIINHDGYVVGFQKGAVNMYTNMSRISHIKSISHINRINNTHHINLLLRINFHLRLSHSF